MFLTNGWWFGVFGVVAPILVGQSGEPSSGLPIVEWRDATQHYGREVVVYGRIVATRNIGEMCFLNFDRQYRRHFTVVVRQADFTAFSQPPELAYDGKLVAVRGTVIRYRNKPEIFISSPRQITVLPDDTPDIAAAVRQHLPAGAQPARPLIAGGELRVATVNLSVLRPADHAFCNADGPADEPAMGRAAALVRRLAADVVAVQWGGSLDCLKRFNEQLLADQGYRYLLGPQEGQERADCVILARQPAVRSVVVSHYASDTGQPVAFAHPGRSAQFQLTSGDVLDLWVTWLPDGPSAAAESAGLRRLLDRAPGAQAGGMLLLAGGFPEAVTGTLAARLQGDGAVALAVPGYTPADPTPPIARSHNYLMGSAAVIERYVPGSTRVEQDSQLDPAVTLAIQTADRPPPPPQPPPSSSDGF